MKKLATLFIFLLSSVSFGQNYIDSYPQAETIKDTMIFIIDYDTTGGTRYTRKVYWIDLKNDISAAAQDSSFTSIQVDTIRSLSSQTNFFYSDQIAHPLLHIISDQNGSVGPRQIWHLDTSTPAAGDIIFSEYFQASSTPDIYGHYDWYIDDATSSAQDGRFQTWIMRNGSQDLAIQIDSLGVKYEFGGAGSIGHQLDIYHNSASPAALDINSIISFSGNNDSAEKISYGSIWAQIQDPTDGSEDGSIAFIVPKNGTSKTMTYNGDLIVPSGGYLGIGTAPSYSVHIQDASPGMFVNDDSGYDTGFSAGSFMDGYWLGYRESSNSDMYVTGMKGAGNGGQFLGAFSIVQESGTGPDGAIVFHTTSSGDAGAAERMRIAHDGGVTVGSPTGGSQGAGTINATAIYDDGVLISGGGADSTFEKISADTLDDNGSGQIFVNSNIDVGGDSGNKIRLFSEGGETSGQGTITIKLDTLILSNDNDGASPKLVFSNDDLVNTGWIMRMNSSQDLHIFANTSNTERVDIQNIGSGKADLSVEGDIDLGGTLDANLVRATQVKFDTAKALSSQILSFRSDTTLYLYDNNPRFGIGALPIDGTALHVYSDQGIFAPRVRFTSDHDGTVGPNLQYFLDTDSPAPGDAIGIITHKSRDSGTNETDYVSIASFIDDETNGNEQGAYVLNLMKAGSETDVLRVDSTGLKILSGGIIVGSPTGGDQGDGTINATAVYDDGVLLSDYVFTEEYQEEMLSIAEMDEFIKRHKHLPTIPGKKTWEEEGRPSLGKLLGQVYETVETQALYIIQLEKRISELENRKN